MKAEIELKFININKDDLREKLLQIGAKKIHNERLMRRKTFDFVNLKLAKGEYKWMRVRDEGDKVTLNMKHLTDAKTIDGVKEIELVVDDFDEACNLLIEMGLSETNYQENYRESWLLKEVEVTIDTWPGLEPLTELEGASEEKVHTVAKDLGFDLSTAMMGSVDFVCQEIHGIPENGITKIKKLTFDKWRDQMNLAGYEVNTKS